MYLGHRIHSYFCRDECDVEEFQTSKFGVASDWNFGFIKLVIEVVQLNSLHKEII